MVMNLNGKWKFSINEKNFYDVNVPSAIQNFDFLKENYPSISMNNSYLGNGVYETEFFIEEKAVENARIYFGGVCPYGEVYVNNERIGEITNCMNSFSFDISKIARTQSNTLKILLKEKNTELLGGMRFDVINWSGIFGDVILFVNEKLTISQKDVVCNLPENKFSLSFCINAYDSFAYTMCIYPKKSDECIFERKIQPLENKVYEEFPLNNLMLWEPENPQLYTCLLKCEKAGSLIESVNFDFGLRQLKTRGNRIYLNNYPFYAFGGGEEYFSVDLSPLADEKIIRRRFEKMKEMGFNFFRYHTHIPSIKEIEIADEEGIFLSVEIPVLSNFNRITDTKKGFEIIEEYIKTTRIHPSLCIYCLGNEGAQLLVRDPKAYKIAQDGYKLIKDNTKNQFALLCFGFQGERPDLKNDIWTPHIWSQEFRWAYDGLTSTPWDFLDGSLKNMPCIIHEYGKFGIWPDEKNDDFIRETGYKMSIKKLNDELFCDCKDLYSLMPQILENSRKLAFDCAKISFEAMRRKSYISGYVYWTLFSMGVRSSGFCDDYGYECFFEPSLLKNTANAPLGIFADKDFSGRTYFSGEYDKIDITVSDFSKRNIESALVKWQIKDSADNIIAFGEEKNIKIKPGECEKVCSFEFTCPIVSCETELTVYYYLYENNIVLCENSCKIWCYPSKKIKLSGGCIYHIKKDSLKTNITSLLSGVTNIWSYISVVLGCVIPECGFEPTDDKLGLYIETALSKKKPSFMITDVFDETAQILSENGIPVLFIDSGNFPKSFYPSPIPENVKFFDLNRFYSPFRSGWDEGNCATIIKGDTVFTEGESDTYGDLRYFDIISDSMPLNVDNTVKGMNLTDKNVVFRVIQKIKVKEKQEENVSVYFEKLQKKKVNDCFYYMEGKLNGSFCAVCACNLFKDANGKYIFEKIVTRFFGKL